MSYRRTIRETVEVGINTLAELQGSLLTAIQVEFSTIPPYLCAQWSINSNNNGDPSDVNGMVQGVVVQEMLHFGLACNMYAATGGSLKGEIAAPDFVPVYPTDGLPGGVHPGLVVSLLPVGRQALRTFMSIEYPEVIPVVQQPDTPPPPAPPAPPTIGQFYEVIAVGFNTVFPDSPLPHDPSLNQVVTGVDSDQLFAVNTVADALNAIKEITDQGEGTSASPDEGTFDPSNLAHYYTFAEIYYGKTGSSGGKWLPVFGFGHHNADGLQLRAAAAGRPRSAHFHQRFRDVDDAVGRVLDERFQHRHSHRHDVQPADCRH